ncbi:MAG TPA: VgrG-related protein [Acidimicrobiales bacterium]|nr:VgrG-related protein [Acidimicrobiales bacterium]
MPPISLTPLVHMSGQPLPATWLGQLIEVRVERQFQVPGRVTLRFADPGYALIDSRTVELGYLIEVFDPTGESTLISAEVTGISVEQQQGQQPELLVVAHDRAHRMGRATSVRTFSSLSYSDVVSQMAANAGLTPDIDSTGEVFPYFMQADSDLGLLTELARRVGFDWWIDGTTLHFKRPAPGKTVSLTWFGGLRSFTARVNGHAPDQAEVDGWDRDQQQQVTASVQATEANDAVKSTSPLAALAAKRSAAFGSATLRTAGIGATTQSEANSLGTALVNRSESCSVSAQGVADGNPAIMPGAVVSIADAGGTVSGGYPVTRVEHTYRPATGYVTRFACGDRHPSTLVDILGGGAGGVGVGGGRSNTPAHLHPGLAVGLVTNIDQSTGRVKVRYPGLTATYETGWARVVAAGGGKARGGVWVPEVNDEVLVAFEGGDPRQPVVIGGLYGAKSTLPPTAITDGAVQQRSLTSRLGHVIQLLDGTEPATQAIELTLAGGEHKLHMGKDKTTLSLPASYELSITAGETSITIGTDGGVTITAPKITLTGEQAVQATAAQVSLSADTELSLQGDVQAALKGGMVQIQSEGPLQAQGEPVMIN